MSAISEKKNVDMLCEAMQTVTPKERNMSANPELEKVLESLARELSSQEEKWFNNETGELHIGMVLAVLKARLLPLLEAGQKAVRDAKIDFNGPTCATLAWDAALRAAMETKL